MQVASFDESLVQIREITLARIREGTERFIGQTKSSSYYILAHADGSWVHQWANENKDESN